MSGRTLRLVLLLGAVVAATIAVLVRLSHKTRGNDAAIAALAGSWRAGGTVLVLRPDAQFLLAVTQSDGLLAPVECGRWRSDGTTLSMRASWLAPAARTGAPGVLDAIKLAQPGLHLGTVEKGTPPAAVSLRSAAPGATPLRLARAPTPPSDAMSMEGRRALEAACNLHLPD